MDKSGRSDEIEVNNKPESIKHGSGWWEFIDPAPRFMLDEKTKTWVPAYPVKCPINPAWKNAQYEVQPPDFTPLPKPRPARSIDPAGPTQWVWLYLPSGSRVPRPNAAWIGQGKPEAGKGKVS